MAVDTISVSLDIKNEWLKNEFEEILAAQQGFHLMKRAQHSLPDRRLRS